VRTRRHASNAQSFLSRSPLISRLPSHIQVQAAEICNAVAGRPATLEVRPTLVRWGFKHSVGASKFLAGSARENEIINFVLDYPELFSLQRRAFDGT
jgi:hypothetical protein